MGGKPVSSDFNGHRLMVWITVRVVSFNMQDALTLMRRPTAVLKLGLRRHHQYPLLQYWVAGLHSRTVHIDAGH